MAHPVKYINLIKLRMSYQRDMATKCHTPGKINGLEPENKTYTPVYRKKTHIWTKAHQTIMTSGSSGWSSRVFPWDPMVSYNRFKRRQRVLARRLPAIPVVHVSHRNRRNLWKMWNPDPRKQLRCWGSWTHYMSFSDSLVQFLYCWKYKN